MTKPNGMYLLTALAAILIMTALIQLEPGILVGAPSTDVTDDWPMFRHDSQRTGYSAFTAPSTNEIKWFYNTSKEIDSAPTVANGRVVVGLSNGNVLALNSTTGERLWIYDTGAGSNSIWGSPAVDSGRVYIGTRDRNLYCLNEATGELLWKYLTGGEIDSSPLVSDGKVFFGSMDGKLYCIDASDGSAVWNFNTSGGIYSSPAILNGVVFTGSYDSKLYAVNALNGVEVWNYSASSASDAIDCSPAISNGRVFFSSSYGNIYCLDAVSGTLNWKVATGSMFIRSSPCVADDRLFIGDSIGKFYCLNAATGSSLWNFTCAPIWSSPAVADAKVFFGTENGRFYCLDESTGTEVWSYQTVERAASSPAISNGVVFIGCGNEYLGGLYAFGAKSTLPTSLSLSLNSQTALLGFKVILNGTLIGNGAPIEGASIVLSFSVTDGQTWNDITAVPTSVDGAYSAVWQPSATGTYLVRAAWAPYYPYEEAESTKMLSVNTFDSQNVFSVVSNSTVSTLAFNSTSQELSFTVSGPTGTVGFVDVAIAKDLVANIADLRIYLDGVGLNYAASSTADSWQLYFTYTHSAHSVIVSLGNTVVPLPPDQTASPSFPTTLIVVAVMIVVGISVGLIVYFKKHKP